MLLLILYHQFYWPQDYKKGTCRKKVRPKHFAAGERLDSPITHQKWEQGKQLSYGDASSPSGALFLAAILILSLPWLIPRTFDIHLLILDV